MGESCCIFRKPDTVGCGSKSQNVRAWNGPPKIVWCNNPPNTRDVRKAIVVLFFSGGLNAQGARKLCVLVKISRGMISQSCGYLDSRISMKKTELERR